MVQPSWLRSRAMSRVRSVVSIRCMLAAERMLVQGFHYPFPALAHIEKTGTGYRETMVPWSPTL